MRNEDVDVVEGESGFGDGFLSGVGHRLDGQLEDLTAGHRDEMLTAFDRVG